MSTEYSTELLGPGAPNRAQEGTSRTINIKRLIRERGLGMFLLFFAVAIPLAVFSWIAVPAEYQAYTLIRVAATRQEPMGDQPVYGNRDYDKFVQTLVEQIDGPTVMSKVANDAAVRSIEWVAKEKDPLSFLMECVTARRLPGTELIQISCMSPYQQAAVDIVSRVADIFAEQAADEERKGVGRLMSTLRDERTALEKKLSAQQEDVSRLRKDAGVPGSGATPPSEIGLEYYHERLSEAESDRATAQAQISVLEANAAQITEARAQYEETPSEPIFSFGIEEAVLQDTSVQALAQREAALSAQIADLRERYVNPEAGPLKAQVERLETGRQALREAKTRRRAEALEAVAEQNRLALREEEKRLENADERIQRFMDIIQSKEQQLKELSSNMAAIREQEAQIEITRQNLTETRERLRILTLSERAPGLVGEPLPPTVPRTPEYGKKLQLIALSLMFAAAVGVGYGLLREFMDQSIHSAKDISYVSDAPVIGAIPHLSAERLPESAEPATLTLEHSGCPTADEYRRVVTRVIYPPEGSAELNTVLITGPSRGEGKTTVACNLALALAQANRRVLLLDISTRRPRVEQRLGLTPGRGLSEVFSGECAAREAVRPGPLPSLQVLGPGLEPQSLIGKLASRTMVEFLEQAEEAYDHVLIDTAPSLLMSDARLLAPIVDGTVVVVRTGHATLGMVRRALADLRQVGANVAGVVLNGVKPTRGGYMRENLSQYYAYRDEDETDAAAPNRSSTEPPGRAGSASMLLLDEAGEAGDGDRAP